MDLERLVAAPERVDIDVGRPGELKDAPSAFEDRRRAGQAGARQRGGGYDGMHLIYEALKKTQGKSDADALIAAAKGMAW